MGYELTKEEKIIQKRREVDFSVEFRLLKALYNNPELFDNPTISPDLFDSKATLHIYDALKNLRERGIKYSKESLLQEYSILDLNASENIVDVVSSEKDAEKVEDPKDIIEHLKDYKRRREANAYLEQAKKIIDSSTRVTDELRDSIRETTLKAEEVLGNSSEDDEVNKVMTMEEWCEMHRNSFTQRRSGKQYFFRNYLFDELLDEGPNPGEIGLIASVTGSGKSTVCENLFNSFIDFQIPSMYFSLEMGAIPMMDRLVSLRTGIPYKQLKDPGENYENIKRTVEEEYEKLKSCEFVRFSQMPDLTINRLEQEIIAFQKATGKKYMIIMIDLLSMMPDFARFFQGANVATGIEFELNRLSAVSKRTGVHIVGTIQLNNKAAESGASITCIDDLQKLRANRAQVKNSNAWLERARYTIVTFRPRMYAQLYLTQEEVDTMDDVIELMIAKVNNDEAGRITRGLFVGPCFKIEPIEEELIPKEGANDVFRD